MSCISSVWYRLMVGKKPNCVILSHSDSFVYKIIYKKIEWIERQPTKPHKPEWENGNHGWLIKVKNRRSSPSKTSRIMRQIWIQNECVFAKLKNRIPGVPVRVLFGQLIRNKFSAEQFSAYFGCDFIINFSLSHRKRF